MPGLPANYFRLKIIFVSRERACPGPARLNSFVQHVRAGEHPTPMKILQPKDWPPPKGYANGIAARGTLVFVAGQIGWNGKTGQFETDDFVEQLRQALVNVLAVLSEAGAKPEHIARFTWYVTDKREYIARLADAGRVYRHVIGKHFPAMALVEVKALVEDRAKIEIEATAVIPD